MVQSVSDRPSKTGSAPVRAHLAPQKSWRFWGATVLVTLVVLATFEAARMRPSAKSPSWIWSLAAVEHEGPAAIALARDFRVSADDLAEHPVLEVRADPGAHVYLNGLHVASTADGRLERASVGELLRPGPNRLLVESSSVSGAGGLWLRLCTTDDSPESVRTLVTSDGSWSVFERSTPALLHGWTLLDDPKLAAQPAHVWGRGGVGRWHEKVPVGEAIETAAADDRVIWAKSSVWSEPTQKTLQIEAELAETAHEEAASRFARGPKPVQPSRGGVQAFGSTILDFGESVEGVLELWIELGPGALPIWFGEKPEDLDGPPHGHVIGLQGHDSWRDVKARAFRYVRIRGAERPSAAVVHQGTVIPELEGPPAGRGPWGLSPPASPQRSAERFAYDPRSLLEDSATRERPSG